MKAVQSIYGVCGIDCCYTKYDDKQLDGQQTFFVANKAIGLVRQTGIKHFHCLSDVRFHDKSNDKWKVNTVYGHIVAHGPMWTMYSTLSVSVSVTFVQNKKTFDFT